MGVAVFLVFSGCHQKKPPEKKQLVTAEQPSTQRVEAQFEGARIIWHDENGNKLFEARFEKAEAMQQGKEAEVRLKGVKAQLYKAGRPTSVLIAPSVVANSVAKEVRASGDVKVISGNGQASARQVTWKAKEDRLVGHGMVTLTRNGLRAKAESLIADTGLGRITLSGGAELSMSD